MPTKADAASAQLQRKSAVIDEIKQRFGDADAAVLTEYRGLTVTDIANLIVTKSVKRVPVVHNGRLVGIVSRADLVRALAQS